jgi:putative transposase
MLPRHFQHPPQVRRFHISDGPFLREQVSVRIDFSRPCRPTDDVVIETSSGTLRDECLNLHWVETLAEARAVIEAWRRDYNESRPHMDFGHRTPSEYLWLTSPSP